MLDFHKKKHAIGNQQAEIILTTNQEKLQQLAASISNNNQRVTLSPGSFAASASLQAPWVAPVAVQPQRRAGILEPDSEDLQGQDMEDNDPSELSDHDSTPTQHSMFQILDAESESNEDEGHLLCEKPRPKLSPEILQTRQFNSEPAQIKYTAEPPPSPPRTPMGDPRSRPTNPN